MKFLFCFLAFILFPVFAPAQTVPNSTFLKIVSLRVKQAGEFQRVCPFESDPIARRVLKEYGSVFVAVDLVKVPARCVFADDQQVAAFRSTLDLSSTKFRDVEITLQFAAMSALLAAVREATEGGVRITPLDGSIAGTRTYPDTVRIWNSRFYRALTHWERKGRIPKKEADEARLMVPSEQVLKVVGWESQGLYFSTNFSRSIFSSVAPPGTSQHLSGLAFDVVEYGNRRVRSILNKHGWFQTVAADEPHFTYLGFPETELPKRGLISVTRNGYKFWVPALP